MDRIAAQIMNPKSHPMTPKRESLITAMYILKMAIDGVGKKENKTHLEAAYDDLLAYLLSL